MTYCLKHLNYMSVILCDVNYLESSKGESWFSQED